MTTNEQRPRWRRNVGGIRGAVGYRDSTGQVVIVVNWEALLFGRRAKSNASERRGDELLDDPAVETLQ